VPDLNKLWILVLVVDRAPFEEISVSDSELEIKHSYRSDYVPVRGVLKYQPNQLLEDAIRRTATTRIECVDEKNTLFILRPIPQHLGERSVKAKIPSQIVHIGNGMPIDGNRDDGMPFLDQTRCGRKHRARLAGARFSDDEHRRLARMFDKGIANGAMNLELLDSGLDWYIEMREM
jgi:hypothetical protein